MTDDPARAAAAAATRGHVHVVEDEEAVRRSLVLLLQLHGYAACAFASAEEYLARPHAARPACALVDMCLPGMSGLALQAQLARVPGALPVLLMTGHGDPALARSALLQGASDFLEKPIDEAELFGAIEVALRADVERLAANLESERLAARIAGLTRGERELFNGITGGRQLREIAEQLGQSLDEVEAGRQRLMEKLEATRLADLFRLRFRLDAGWARR